MRALRTHAVSQLRQMEGPVRLAVVAAAGERRRREPAQRVPRRVAGGIQRLHLRGLRGLLQRLRPVPRAPICGREGKRRHPPEGLLATLTVESLAAVRAGSAGGGLRAVRRCRRRPVISRQSVRPVIDGRGGGGGVQTSSCDARGAITHRGCPSPRIARCIQLPPGREENMFLASAKFIAVASLAGGRSRRASHDSAPLSCLRLPNHLRLANRTTELPPGFRPGLDQFENRAGDSPCPAPTGRACQRRRRAGEGQRGATKSSGCCGNAQQSARGVEAHRHD